MVQGGKDRNERIELDGWQTTVDTRLLPSPPRLVQHAHKFCLSQFQEENPCTPSPLLTSSDLSTLDNYHPSIAQSSTSLSRNPVLAAVRCDSILFDPVRYSVPTGWTVVPYWLDTVRISCIHKYTHPQQITQQTGRRLEIEPINNPFFSITGLKSASLKSGKIAPGMEISYILKFTPEKEIDYFYNLVCTTERETFLVPVNAIGARGESGFSFVFHLFSLFFVFFLFSPFI